MNELPDINIDTEYGTYEGLSRVAMVWGVPLIPGFIIVMVFMSATMFLLPFYDLKAVGIFLLAIPCLVFLRYITKKDDQAIRILCLEIYWWFVRRKSNLFGDTLTITATKFGRERDDYIRCINEKSEEAAVAARLFSESQSTRC
ncbi:VirB3 family type IV secretion system protein [Neisseria sp.]|uniref:VirB3 family type IV secretion system protein n=1 Tax=Neisseria sp. TaxID=192066 RepID=UPI00359F5F67